MFIVLLLVAVDKQAGIQLLDMCRILDRFPGTLLHAEACRRPEVLCRRSRRALFYTALKHLRVSSEP